MSLPYVSRTHCARSSQDRFWKFSKRPGGATVADLADALEMAPVSVRHHLDILQGDNLIRVGAGAQRAAVGRPQQVYALTDEAGALFPTTLLRWPRAGAPDETCAAARPGGVRSFVNMAHEMAGEADLQRALEALPIESIGWIGCGLSERAWLSGAVGSRTSAIRGGSYLLHKHNCPYAGVSGEHRELCLMDETVGRPAGDRALLPAR
jgi:DNA-binding transcriptional ArsR family regulator